MKHKFFKFLTPILLFVGLGISPNLWAWEPFYLIGNFTGDNWSGDNLKSSNVNQHYDSDGNSGRYFLDVRANGTTQYFAFVKSDNTRYRPSDQHHQIYVDYGAGCGCYNDGTSDYSWEYPQGKPGIIRICISQQKSGNDDRNYYPWVWIEWPTVYLRHKWQGVNDYSCGDDGWGQSSAMTRNSDGTYTLDAKYSGNSDGYSWYTVYEGSHVSGANLSIIGNPSRNDKCKFVYDVTDLTVTVTRYDKVTYNANGATAGSAPSAQEQLHGQSLNLAAKPDALAKTGYIFNGWNTQEDGQGTHYAANSSYTMNGDVTLYAEWKKQTYVVTFGGYNDNEHGSLEAKVNNVAITSPADVDASATVNFTAKPATGYTVEGWYSNEGCTTKITSPGTSTTYSPSITAATTVYVKFKAQVYSISYKDQGNQTFSGTHASGYPTQHTYDQSTELKSATRDGYNFLGWHKASNCDDAEITQIGGTEYTADITLYAKWEEKLSTITINTPNAAQGTLNVTGEKSLGVTTRQQIVATPKAGYYLKEWQVSGAARVTDSKNTTTTVYTDGSGEAGTVQAVFEFRWVLRGSRSDNSGDEGMPGFSTTTDVFTFAADATEGTKTVTLLPNREYKFMVYDRKHSAQRGYGSNTKLDANVWSGIMNGNMHLLMNTAGYGTYTFKVKENGDYPQIYITNPTSHLITMNTKTYSDGNASGDTGGTLTAKTTENGQDFEVSNDKYVRDGGSVTFTATPKTGYTFAGFYSDANCTGTQITEGVVDNKYTATISANKAVYAKFTENLTPVTLYIGGNGKVKVGSTEHKGGDIFKVGVYTKVTFTLEPGEHCKFDGWTKSTGADFTMDDNTLKGNGAGRTDGQILTANFVELDKIYFLNKKFGDQYQWNDVHVYFDAYWDNTNGAGADGRTHVHMNRIEGTDIWWAYVPSGFTGTNIAFSQEDMNNYKNFDKVYDQNSHGVYRNDFKKAHNMYIPRDNGAKHNCYYFSNGYWMKYDPKALEGVGYYLKRKTDGHQYGEFKAIDFTNDGTLTSTITISVDENSQQTLYIVSAGAENYADENGLTKDHKSTVLSKYESNPSLGFTPNGTGDYTFRLIQGNGLNMSIEVDFPAEDNDYRVIYNNGTKDHPSQAIQGGDLVSFFVDATAVSDAFRIQQFTDGTWTNKVTSIAIPSEITESGVYNFQLADDGSSLTYKGAYTGNYYIRTDVAGGGWHNYKGNEKNLMAKGYIFGYNNTYDYAYTNWAGPNTNVKYTVANDYSICLSDSLEQGDEVIGVDKQALGEDGANIRFMWNSKTNELKRDYIGGSNDDEKFLLIHGSDNAAAASKTKSKLYETADAASPVDSAKFHDDGNWIYSKEVYVEPGAFAALTAHFNSTTQFFHGAGNAETGEVSTYEQFVGGSGTNRLKMKVIYNFKTNELVAGYIPDGETITETINLHSDLLWIRTQQGDATPINFSSTGVQIENIRKIYGVLEFCKDSMTNLYDGATKKPLTNSSYDRINYWISFPFNVKVSEIFGVDGYGEKWVIQYYNGELRAEMGWFAEKSSFWEWLDLDDIMYAGKGYTLNIDPEYFDEPSDDIWKNVDSKVAFYFPSAANYNVNVIKQQEVTTKIPDHEYYRSVKFENNPEKDHKITDSYWNIIGTPAFQPTEINTAEGKGPKAVYVWKQGKEGSNGYDVVETMTGFTFKPMRSYIVQYGGNVTWNSVSSIVKAQAPYAYADQKNYMVDLEFYFGEKRDHTYINLSDNATKGFKLNEDVVKMTNSGEPNIYSYAEGYDVAYNEMPMENQTVNLGVIARKNGTYTFAMPKDFSGKAILIDLESGEATDLNLSNYTVELNKGTYNNRFQLVLEVEAKAPTKIDNAKGEWSADGKTKKFFINDNIYLINAGRIYNASGTQVK